jgi:hypothetical protein
LVPVKSQYVVYQSAFNPSAADMRWTGRLKLIGDVALMFKKREAANLGGLRYVLDRLSD